MKKRLVAIIMLISMLMPQMSVISNAVELESNEYGVTDQYISRINPKTEVSIFKEKLKATSMKIYKDKNKTKEVTNGYVGTNMHAEYEGKMRALSVVGDINKDGIANQLDLSRVIRHILEFEGEQITDEIEKMSADITGDNKINNVDVTALIRYNIFGEFYITVGAPEIKNIGLSTTIDSISIRVTADKAEDGIYQYSYKEAGASTYTDAIKTKENSYTIEGLKTNTKYVVRVKVTNKYGMTDVEEKEITTGKRNIDVTVTGALERRNKME